MTVTVAAAPRASVRHNVRPRTVYLTALGVWLVTRFLVLVHQGAWPWMNAFVVAAARGMIVGDWNDAVRPQLPAFLGVPLVLLGATEQQVVAALYILASLVQFGAFLVLVRALFPARLFDQALALLVFLLLPYNHSIHQYRDVPVVLASSGVFLIAAHFLRTARRLALTPQPPSPEGEGGGAQMGIRQEGWAPVANGHASQAARTVTERSRRRELSVRDVGWVGGAMLLGVWSRTEVLTFVAMLVLLGLVAWRGSFARTAALYAVSAFVVLGMTVGLDRLEGIDATQAARYQWHTFLDSTPESWLTQECRADPTENCRERDGLLFFGPAPAENGVLPMIAAHPLTTVAKTLQSALDNLWIMLGANLSTFPGIVPFLLLTVAFVPEVRRALGGIPLANWLVAVAALSETVLPPLSWAPPHPQYHAQLIVSVVVVTVPVLVALASLPRGRVVATAFFVASAALSVFRYTRYPGY